MSDFEELALEYASSVVKTKAQNEAHQKIRRQFMEQSREMEESITRITKDMEPPAATVGRKRREVITSLNFENS